MFTRDIPNILIIEHSAVDDEIYVYTETADHYARVMSSNGRSMSQHVMFTDFEAAPGEVRSKLAIGQWTSTILNR